MWTLSSVYAGRTSSQAVGDQTNDAWRTPQRSSASCQHHTMRLFIISYECEKKKGKDKKEYLAISALTRPSQYQERVREGLATHWYGGTVLFYTLPDYCVGAR